MKYEINKVYIINKALPILGLNVNDKLVLISQDTEDINLEFFIACNQIEYYLTGEQMDLLLLISEDISFTMHVLKYAQQDLNDNSYEDWISWKLVEEAREVFDVLNGEICNRKNIIEEMGDLFYFFTAICEKYDLTLEEIKEANIKKLQKRFQKGYWNEEEAKLKRDYNG